ncbi:hypothetical protein HC341_00865 [Aquisalimonas sp. 2447]|nr:hypothetical protein HC341_00865 [Aquisalimonas sp. 2447]
MNGFLLATAPLPVHYRTPHGDVPPAKAYLDELESYSTNEYAIDYTAPLVFALAYFNQFERSMPDDISSDSAASREP